MSHCYSFPVCKNPFKCFKLNKYLYQLSHECQAVQLEAYFGVYFMLNKLPDRWYHVTMMEWTHSFGNIWIHFHYNTNETNKQKKKELWKSSSYEGRSSFKNQDCSILSKDRDNFPLSMNIKTFHIRVLTSCLGPSHSSRSCTQVHNVPLSNCYHTRACLHTPRAAFSCPCLSSPQAAALILLISTLATPTFRTSSSQTPRKLVSSLPGGHVRRGRVLQVPQNKGTNETLNCGR